MNTPEVTFVGGPEEALGPQKFAVWQEGGAPSARQMRRRQEVINSQAGRQKGTKNATPKRKRKRRK